MGIDTDGFFGCFFTIAGVILIVGSLVFFGIPLLNEAHDAKTDQLNAEAILQQAKADTERAKGEAQAMITRAYADREHQQETDWQHTFMVYSMTLAAFLDGGEVWLILISVVLGIIVGGLAITALGKVSV